MLWFIFAFLAAFIASVRDVLNKQSLKYSDEYLIPFSSLAFSIPFLLPIVYFRGFPTLGAQFWPTLLIAGAMHTAAGVLSVKALKHSDLSITAPMISFTPIFMLITSPFMIGEFPNMQGFIGVILGVAGAYVLNIKERHRGYFEPFRALLRQKGPRYMLAVAFIWSITANLDKVGYQNSDLFFWVVAINSTIALFLVPIMLYKSDAPFVHLKKNFMKLFPLGVATAAMGVVHMIAISLTLVTYVISVKRTSILMSVLWGHFHFKENGAKERILGTIIMLLGVVLILFS